MPPKKRKAGAATKAQPAKKVRIGSASAIEDSPSGRPRRSTSNDAPQYKLSRAKKSSSSSATAVKSQNALPAPAPKRRGRPPKIPEAVVDVKKSVLKRGRGRQDDDIDEDEEDEEEDADMAPPPPKKRGRPPKVVSPASFKTTKKTVAATAPVKRGRKVSAKAEEEYMDETSSGDELGENTTTTLKVDAGHDQEEIDDTIQYWLMKAEPESRIEKGHDVKFSIDDLAAKAEPEGWDGVRNPVARNNMRAMRRGDLAFFYHSNCSVPGVAGVMRIVEEHSIDESAFDPTHPYYDAKSSRDKPKWELVKVEFVKKFDTYITLKQLRTFAEAGGKLQNMQMLKQSRLSVSAVRPEEWRFILDLADEGHALGHGVRVDGYESDTDGEVEDQEKTLAKEAALHNINGVGSEHTGQDGVVNGVTASD